jgi:hypothetical protein
MDEEFERRGRREAPLLKAKPSEYMTNGQFYYAFELEETTSPYVTQRVGSGLSSLGYVMAQHCAHRKGTERYH